MSCIGHVHEIPSVLSAEQVQEIVPYTVSRNVQEMFIFPDRCSVLGMCIGFLFYM